MGIKFASGGFLTTVQDMGRTGYQESGMSVSGVMDQRSAAIANILVGNDENEAVLEVTLMGPMMEFCRSEDDPSKYEKEKSDAGGLLPDRENHPRCHGTAG